jgi:hypothetical protein
LQPNLINGTTAREELTTLRAREEAILNSYGWVNQEAEIVRIPIDRAIDLFVEQSP